MFSPIGIIGVVRAKVTTLLLIRGSSKEYDDRFKGCVFALLCPIVLRFCLWPVSRAELERNEASSVYCLIVYKISKGSAPQTLIDRRIVGFQSIFSLVRVCKSLRSKKEKKTQ